MSKYYRIVLFIPLIWIITILGCVPCYYTPNIQNVPMFKEAKEIRGSFSFQFGSYSSGYNIQTAFSVSNHVGIMLNYHHFSASYDEDIFNNFSKTGRFRGNMGEIGAGYFLGLNYNFMFETYAGIGWGGVTNEVDEWTYTYKPDYWKSKVNYTRYFLQPAFGWSPVKYFSMAFSTRFCLLDYRKLKLYNATSTISLSDLIELDNNPAFLIEPALTVRAGGEKVKFQLQTCVSYYPGNEYAYFDPMAVNLGVIFRLSPRKTEIEPTH